jgi:hypothetical protein
MIKNFHIFNYSTMYPLVNLISNYVGRYGDYVPCVITYFGYPDVVGAGISPHLKTTSTFT